MIRRASMRPQAVGARHQHILERAGIASAPGGSAMSSSARRSRARPAWACAAGTSHSVASCSAPGDRDRSLGDQRRRRPGIRPISSIAVLIEAFRRGSGCTAAPAAARSPRAVPAARPRRDARPARCVRGRLSQLPGAAAAGRAPQHQESPARLLPGAPGRRRRRHPIPRSRSPLRERGEAGGCPRAAISRGGTGRRSGCRGRRSS